MKTKIYKARYHKNTPKLLLLAFKENDYGYSATARQLGVNKAVVWNMIKKGIEPQDKNIRQAIGLEKPDWLIAATDWLEQRQKEMEKKNGTKKITSH